MPKRSRMGETYLLAPGEWIQGKERYQIQGFLGQGGFAAAYKALNEAGEVCFIKEYFPPSRPGEASELSRVYSTERDVIRRIGNYELIPRFWDAMTYEGYSYIVTDFIPGPDLETVLRSGQKPDIETLKRWSVCLCHELAFLHSRNVVHHDLKPDNVRLNDDGDPVIVDFSAAHWYRKPGETTDALYGSDSFLAPEYLERSTEDAEAGKRMDVFAMGRILVELMVGQRLTQEEIDRRADQLYGEILHSGKLDISFVRAVFKSVSYDPARRYESGVELAEDIVPAAPPLGRLRPKLVHFGKVADAAPKEVTIQCYNAGGGTLRADIQVDGDWIEVGTSGVVTGKSAMFERNRQTVRLIAYPERVPPGGQAFGRVVFTFQTSIVELPVQIQRAADVANVQVNPQSVKIGVPADGKGTARLMFSNGGKAPTRVQLWRPPDFNLGIEPAEFTLPAGGKQEVTVSVDSAAIGQVEATTEIRWAVEDNPRPNLPVTASQRQGGKLLGALADKFRRK